MSITWWLNTAQMYVLAVGAILIVFYLWKSRHFADQWLSPEGKLAYTKHIRPLIIAVGLLASWIVLQYLAILIL